MRPIKFSLPFLKYIIELSSNDYPFNCNNLKDRGKRVSQCQNFSEFCRLILAMQCNLDLIHCSTTLLETIPRFMSNIHRAHIFSLQTWFLRDRICFFTVLLEYCFPKWINRRSNRTYNYNDEFIRLLFWTISQLCYLQKKKKKLSDLRIR